MEKIRTSKDCLLNLFSVFVKNYNEFSQKEIINSAVQFELTHFEERILCYLLIDESAIMSFHFGEIENFKVKLSCSLYNWLALANKKLNPVLGVMTKKLKFSGDIRFFKRIMKTSPKKKVLPLVQDPPREFEKNPQIILNSVKNILVINGSPRAQRGFTYHYLAQFVKGMRKNNSVNIEEIHLAEKKINGCLGCFQCWMNNSDHCIQKDDVDEIYEKYLNADMVIYAFPLYADSVPAIMKQFMDRIFCKIYPFMEKGIYKTRHPRKFQKDKICFIFSICGFPEVIHFNAVKELFNAHSHNGFMPVLGGLYRSAGMFLPNNPLYFELYETVMKALEQFGEELISKKHINLSLKKQIEKEPSFDDFRNQTNITFNAMLQKNTNNLKNIFDGNKKRE